MKRYKIRKLTPRECGRLMDVEDPDIDKVDIISTIISKLPLNTFDYWK